ncbi:MAG: BMP family ABC transporter substrate-binding protein [Spirochaetales bacterium]|nr:BMP family ABC transporter substrate-binding protein [Spirochaetales bacterium]
MMKYFMKVTLIVCLILFISFTLTAMPSSEKKPAPKMLVSMATDVGGLGDKSFNDGSYAGLEKARDNLGVDIKVIESKQMTDYVPNLSGLAEDGSKLVFAVGFLMADAIMESAANFPDTYFAGIDIWVDPASAPKNVIGINYKEQESGYIAGVVAGMLTKEFASASPKLNDKNVVGMVLGMDIPPVERYQAGFYAGVKLVNPDCKVISIVTGVFDDQAKGKEATFVLAEQGADIVFQIAGLTGLGVLNGAKDKGIFAIGVDVDQNYIAPETVITSALKGITESSYLVIESVVNNRFKGGQTLMFGINENSTGISSFHGLDSMVPQAVKDKVNEVIASLKSGAIVAPTSRADAKYDM